MWKSIGVAIVLMGVLMVNTPVVAQTVTTKSCSTLDAQVYTPCVQKIVKTLTPGKSQDLTELLEELNKWNVSLTVTQLDEVILKGSSEVSRESSLSSIFPPKKSTTTVTVSYNEGVWSSKSFISVSVDRFLSGIMLAMIIATSIPISGIFGKSSTWRPVSAGIVVGSIAGILIGTAVGPTAGGLAGFFAGVLAGFFAGTISGIFVGGFAGVYVGGFAGMYAGDYVPTSVYLGWIAFCVGLIALEFAVYFTRTFIRRKFDEYKNKQGVPTST